MAKRGEGDITDILEEIRHEKQMKERLDQSIQHLSQEVTDLEKKAETPVTGDDIEWKTRHDIQADVNKMLSGRISELQEKLDGMKQSMKSGQMPQVLRRYDDMNETAMKKLIRDMEREMTSLTSELNHLEFRLDQESQKYHKADEERKNVQMAIEQLKRDMATMKRQNTLVVTLGADLDRPMDGLPRNRRILNPRLGPVRSSAVVNRLPRLPAKPQKKGKSSLKNPDGKKVKRRERK
ncbi:PREDICTED: coiled-coil domain-containing protein 169-like [Branchiostoma belcheri]|uniref:Coiled-coil domain-containing protein 169-like n=1 Tax=Branchiostoma belcheri TaxID=7741 RepID=A0A6P5A4P2_BRABE|nr:PREDICTED: coiled-coil domain-containing protein 169-like [Branchiostoma belcheri]